MAGAEASIRLIDVNGDHKADVCGRTMNGVVCALSTGVRPFARATLVSYPAVLGSVNDVTGYPAPLDLGTDCTDALGWGQDLVGSTIQFGTLVPGNPRLGVCARSSRGLQCGL